MLTKLTIGLAGAGVILRLKWYNNYNIYYNNLKLIFLFIFIGKYRYNEILNFINLPWRWRFYSFIYISIKKIENLYNNWVKTLVIFQSYIVRGENFISLGEILLYNQSFCCNFRIDKENLFSILNNNYDIKNDEINLCGETQNLRLRSDLRIGPHNIDILSIIIGSVLGDTHLGKNKRGKGTRIEFAQSNKNVEYLMWFHNYLSVRGYCNARRPELKKNIGKNGEIYYYYKINSYTYTSFNWLHDMFYSFNLLQNKWVKVIPLNIGEYLTPLALAIWFMDDGSRCMPSVRIATDCFTEKEVLFLCEVLKVKYGILSSKVSTGRKGSYYLYIRKSSLPLFSSIVKPYMLPSMYYKLNGY